MRNRTNFLGVLVVGLLLISSAIQAQVKGKVTNEEGQNLDAVSIIVKETGAETTSKSDGSYEINANQGETIIFSLIGHTELRKVVDNPNAEINVTLQAGQELSKITVKGFPDVNSQARRRVKSVQELPESTITLTEVAIEAAGITNLQSFSNNVPNLQFAQSQNIGVNFLTVRGIPQIRNGDAPVALVIDGVYNPDANILNQELFDVAMIEVVKGPQGALYGKNAIAGAINIVSQKPTNDFSGKAKVFAGNGSLYGGSLSLNMPIIKDKLFFRGSVLDKSFGGLIENTQVNKMIDERKSQYFRGQVDYNITENFSAFILGQYSTEDGKGPNYAHAPLNDPNNPKEILDMKNFNDVIDAGDIGKANLKNTFTALKIKYSTEDINIQSVTSYNDVNRFHEGDLDFTPVGLSHKDAARSTFFGFTGFLNTSFGTEREILPLYQKQTSTSKIINQEIRIGNNDTKTDLNWDLGVFYQEAKKGFESYEGLFPDVIGLDFENIYTTYAGFAFVEYKVSDELNLSGGLRYDYDDIKQDNTKEKKEFSTTKQILQPKASVSYKLTNDNMIFLGYGLGYRNGGFNGKASPLYGEEYKAETSHNFEVGSKNSFMDNRLILNAAVFYTLMNDQQQYRFTFFNNENIIGNFNFEQTSIVGFETDLKFRINTYLDISGSYGLTKSKIEKGGIIDVVNLDANKELVKAKRDLGKLYNGNTTPMVPLQNISVALESNFVINQGLEFNGRAGMNTVGEIYWHEDNEVKSDPYNLVNIRLGITYNKNYSIAFWTKNLLDTKYYQEVYAGTESATGWRTNSYLPGDIAWRGQPTTFGVDLVVRF